MKLPDTEKWKFTNVPVREEEQEWSGPELLRLYKEQDGSENQQPDFLCDGYKISQYFSHHYQQTSETGKAIEQHVSLCRRHAYRPVSRRQRI